MRFEARSGAAAELACDLLAFPVFTGESAAAPGLRSLDRATRGLVAAVLSSGEFRPDLHRTCLLHRPAGHKAARLLLVGAGPREQLDLATLRDLAGTVVRAARPAAARTAALVRRDRLADDRAAQAAVEGALAAGFDLDVYRTRERDDPSVETFVLLGRRGGDRAAAERGIRRGTIVGEATNFVRALVNEPSNVMTPSEFVARVTAHGSALGIEAEVLERADMERLGMNALLAVARGSEEPPKLLVLRLPGPRRPGAGTLHAIVGKGVTFDSGGISIKPADRMEEMKADMAGGAAVAGAMIALAQLGAREPVIGLVPLVENLPSGRAVKPGDVVRAYTGKTVEIVNTDAEGRLILADALGYARTLGATSLLDIATLTGACVVALGTVNAAMMGTDQPRIDRLRANCAITGEKLWQLPLDEAYRRLIRSDIADMKNVGPRWGGAITAGKFLQEFADTTPWVHLDIAGVDLLGEDRPYLAKGATGFGVRTFVELLAR